MDWAKVVQTIQENGFSQMEIANFCGCTQPQISTLFTKKRGRRISFDIGTKILEMKKKIESGELTKSQS